MTTDSLFQLILSRRTRRKYTEEDVSSEVLEKLCNAARWAPSGLNNQPWRFILIKDQDVKKKLGTLTKYSRIVETSNACIGIFYHLPSGYNRDKDLMSIGAAIQNVLLCAEVEGLGAAWLGEILNQKDDVQKLLQLDANNELMALIALGYSEETPHKERKELEELMLPPLC